MLNSLFDVVVHMALSFSISSKFSMRGCKVASPQIKRESYRDVPMKGFIFIVADAKVLTRY
jgi:hypothetical protein